MNGKNYVESNRIFHKTLPDDYHIELCNKPGSDTWHISITKRNIPVLTDLEYRIGTADTPEELRKMCDDIVIPAVLKDLDRIAESAKAYGTKLQLKYAGKTSDMLSWDTKTIFTTRTYWAAYPDPMNPGKFDRVIVYGGDYKTRINGREYYACLEDCTGAKVAHARFNLPADGKYDHPSLWQIQFNAFTYLCTSLFNAEQLDEITDT